MATESGGFLHDEQGNLSMGRMLLALHTAMNWIWIWMLLTGVVSPPDSNVLTLLIGQLDVTMFIVFGAWVVGPRSFQYLLPQIGKAVDAASGLVRRMVGVDRRGDDERGRI